MAETEDSKYMLEWNATQIHQFDQTLATLRSGGEVTIYAGNPLALDGALHFITHILTATEQDKPNEVFWKFDEINIRMVMYRAKENKS